MCMQLSWAEYTAISRRSKWRSIYIYWTYFKHKPYVFNLDKLLQLKITFTICIKTKYKVTSSLLKGTLLVCDSWWWLWATLHLGLSTKFGLVFILWWCRDWVYSYRKDSSDIVCWKLLHILYSNDLHSYTSATLGATFKITKPIMDTIISPCTKSS